MRVLMIFCWFLRIVGSIVEFLRVFEGFLSVCLFSCPFDGFEGRRREEQEGAGRSREEQGGAGERSR